MLRIRVGAGISIFRQKFYVTVPIHLVEEPFSVSQNVWYQKLLWIGEGGVEGGSTTFFCQKFVSQGGEENGRGTFLFFGIFLVSKMLGEERSGYYDFPSEFFCHSNKSIRRGTLLCLTKCLVSRSFVNKRGRSRGREYHDFFSKNFVSGCWKNS